MITDQSADGFQNYVSMSRWVRHHRTAELSSRLKQTQLHTIGVYLQDGYIRFLT